MIFAQAEPSGARVAILTSIGSAQATAEEASSAAARNAVVMTFI
jgi:hypothetical protein